MPFKYACFVSYRHGDGELANRFIADLCGALKNEIELWLGSEREVYLDREKLNSGDFFNRGLASALCQSVCMVMVYTPTYFDKTHRYCAREFRAMEMLEEKRLTLLGGGAKQTHGLIIPVVFRGARRLPKYVKSCRQFFNFDSFLLSDPHMSKHPLYAPEIKKIAEYIADRCFAFADIGKDPCGDCVNFELPSEEDIGTWLEALVAPPLGFPPTSGVP